MHIKNATNSQLSLTHLAQLAAYRIYTVARYIPYIFEDTYTIRDDQRCKLSRISCYSCI